MWSDAFLAKIAEKHRSAEVWVVEVFEAYQEPHANTGYSIGTAEGYCTEAIMAGPPRCTGSRLTPVSWQSTVGSVSVQIHGDTTQLRTNMTRGTVVRVLCTFLDWTHGVYELVYWGMVWNCTGVGVEWTLEIRDPISAMQNRLSTTTPELFNTNNHTTTLNGAFSAGATTATVADTSSFEFDTQTPIGAIKIESEYITYTGKTGTTFTGCTRGAFGTTDATHSDTTTVTEVVLLRGHPLDIALRLLVSRGVTGNSSYDDYPSFWGFGMNQSLVDIDDIEQWRDEVVKVASGSYQWDVVIEGTWDNPASQFVSYWGAGGFYPAMRQGRLTIRGGKGPTMDTTPPYLAEFTITDEEIIAGFTGITIDLWDPNQSVEFRYVRASTYSDNLDNDEGAVGTLPSERRYTYDVAGWVFTNQSAVRTEMVARLARCGLRVPMAIRLRLAGMLYSALTPGDVVALQSERMGIADFMATGGSLCLVSQVSADWAANVVDVTLLSYPDEASQFETISVYLPVSASS